MCCSYKLSEKILARILEEHEVRYQKISLPRGKSKDPANQIRFGAGVTVLVDDFNRLPEDLKAYLLSVSNQPASVPEDEWTTVVVKEKERPAPRLKGKAQRLTGKSRKKGRGSSPKPR